jgi:peptidoglycan biosynthesis protein MviN/MurJ (putative lipid II flippase)
MLGGFWIIILAEHRREEWHTGEIKKGDPRRIWLTVIMVALFLTVMAFESLRNFFELTTLSSADIGIVVVAMAAWAFGLFVMLRYDLLERLFIPDYAHDGNISDATTQKSG